MVLPQYMEVFSKTKHFNLSRQVFTKSNRRKLLMQKKTNKETNIALSDFENFVRTKNY